MSNELRALLARVEESDAATAQELRRHIDALQNRRQFGLNFERHTPESVTLTGRSISVGDKVQFLPSRGETEVESDATWIVTSISGPKNKRVAALVDPKNGEEATRALEDLVYVADFRDPIYPGLKRSDEPVLHGGNKPFHTVLNAENYHALEALLFTHQGAVNCIYIDPPYNTGAKDWKYNNDYVDGEDSYRHSKWLAFMERRLKLAKRLLDPADSVLIVTIDEKEYLRLGMLLEQMFPEANIQMVSSVINPKGTARANEFSRVDEFIYFVMIGDYQLRRWSSDMLTERDYSAETHVRWRGMARTGRKGLRPHNPGSWYPIFLNEADLSFHSVGDTVYENDPVTAPHGTVAMWPPVSGSDQYSWSVVPSTFRQLHERGAIRFGRPNFATQSRSVYYLTTNQLAMIASGAIEVTGKDDDGALQVQYAGATRSTAPKTQWNRTSHEAGAHGTNVLRALLPDRRFPFPKSLYAVEDALRFFLQDKPGATVLDFFAGSGTTAHAVMRLNKQDGGRRQCISVTNNEVGDNEQRELTRKGFRQGDPEWEKLGICDYITKPRLRATVTGLTPNDEPIQGDYKFTDEFPMAEGFEENVEFFTLSYENPALVELDLSFERVAPLLWMRAGSQGRRIESRSETFDVADTYAVLFDVDASTAFLWALEAANDLRLVYVVTDDETQYQAVAGQLPEGVESVRLYESYLRTFQINTGRA